MNRIFFVIFFIIPFVGAEEIQAELCVHKFSGDFYLKSGDTLNEDVSVSGGNATIDGVINGDLAIMGGSVIVNGMVDGDIAVFGGEIENKGKITGDAAVAGGSIKNKGYIEGEVAVTGGSVILDSGSVIDGDIAIIGGSVDKSDYAIVKGKITTLDIGKIDKVMPRISHLLKLGQKQNPFKAFITSVSYIAFLLVLYLFNLLCLVIFPSVVEKIAHRMKNYIWTGIAIGIGIEILFVPLIILFVISIIGIPIIPAFIIALFIAIIFGLSGFSYVLGEKVIRGLNWQLNNRIAIFTIGWLTTMIVLIIGMLLKEGGFFGTLILILGITIFYVASTIGLGSAVYALIKKN
uniref:Polymer-forming cytoskeletal protein n=1 Tax=candidate division WOR-3 bacterium TaxID=2052148 RepID=A0A7V3VTY8_UNCW3